MKRLVRTTFVTAVALAVMSGAAVAQKAQMAGKGHDIRAAGNTGDLCAACHTAHNAGTNYGALLWNRSISTATFTYYNTTINADFKGGVPDLTGGSKISLLCMSCHDGTIALDAVLAGNTPSGTTFKTGLIPTTNGARLSTDLSNDHPVAFSYDSSLTALPALYKEPVLAKVFGATGSRRVECASCHDVHGIAAKMLRAPNTGSQLCLDCHK